MSTTINGRKSNCLDLIRLVAAIQVMFGHCVTHLKLPISDSLSYASYFIRGVPIFFVISGYLIWFSVDRTKTFRQYLLKRFWRIYPELWGAVSVEIILLIFLYPGWRTKSLIAFSLCQGSIFQFWTPDSLRGYGVGTPNGALWTIGVMIQSYIFIWFFYKYMKNKKIVFWIFGFILSIIIGWGGLYVTHHGVDNQIIGKLYDQTFIKYFWLFYFGMFIAAFQDYTVSFLQNHWYFLLAAAFGFFWTGWDLTVGYNIMWSLFLTSGLIGFSYAFPQLSLKPDISYGLFLYHMIVVNVFVNFGCVGSWGYAILVFLISTIVAYISTISLGQISAKKKQAL